jgi:hypothetical protein
MENDFYDLEESENLDKILDLRDRISGLREDVLDQLRIRI